MTNPSHRCHIPLNSKFFFLRHDACCLFTVFPVKCKHSLFKNHYFLGIKIWLCARAVNTVKLPNLLFHSNKTSLWFPSSFTQLTSWSRAIVLAIISGRHEPVIGLVAAFGCVPQVTSCCRHVVVEGAAQQASRAGFQLKRLEAAYIHGMWISWWGCRRKAPRSAPFQRTSPDRTAVAEFTVWIPTQCYKTRQYVTVVPDPCLTGEER